MPWLPIYDVIVALLVIIPMGLIFFSSAFLYNKLCDRDLLTSDENRVCRPLSSKWAYLLVLLCGMGIAYLFYVLITNDSFDFSLLFIVPPLVVAILCELKNGFVPLISDVLVGICVLCRILYYGFFHGFDYGLSIFFCFLFAFVVVFIPKVLLDRTAGISVNLLSVLALALMASYFSLIYSLIFVGSVYLIMTLAYEIPNFISIKRKGSPIFTFEFPILLLASAVFAVMLLI